MLTAQTKKGASGEAARKFMPDGRARHFSGNTIISKVLPGSPLAAMLEAVRREFSAQRYAHCLKLLPQASYHMTVFEGVTERSRVAGLWPANLPLDASMAVCHRHMERALAGWNHACPLPLKMRPVELSAGRHPGAALKLAPFDLGEENKLRRLRDQLSDRLMIRTPDHDDYEFHISLGYLLKTMSDAELLAYATTRATHLARLTAAFPVIEFGAPQFCTFNDMLTFNCRLTLDAPCSSTESAIPDTVEPVAARGSPR